MMFFSFVLVVITKSQPLYYFPLLGLARRSAMQVHISQPYPSSDFEANQMLIVEEALVDFHTKNKQTNKTFCMLLYI